MHSAMPLLAFVPPCQRTHIRIQHHYPDEMDGLGLREEEIDRRRNERTALRSVLKRAEWGKSECKSILKSTDGHPSVTNLNHGAVNVSLPTLPEAGVSNAIRNWMNAARSDTSKSSEHVCNMPPSRSCHTDTFTIITMAHNTDRFEKLAIAFRKVFPRFIGIGLTEIIFVWNAPRSDLEGAARTSSQNATKISIKISRAASNMPQWHSDPKNHFRIFFSLEEGLTNNVLNRYHPSIRPKNEACLYFDDDGPFYTTDDKLLRSGIELWKRNSDIQVGIYGRYLTFSSERINNRRRTTPKKGIDDNKLENNNFIPLCLSAEQEKLTYNVDRVVEFGASIILPTGSIIHRNYLCLIWHPAFEELRQFVLNHTTAPDDMMVSILIAQFSRRGAKVYPTKKFVSKAKAKLNEDKINQSVSANNTSNSPPPNASHRRLLWERPHWFEYRADAINSILGYFGTLHPGSIPVSHPVSRICATDSKQRMQFQINRM